MDRSSVAAAFAAFALFVAGIAGAVVHDDGDSDASEANTPAAVTTTTVPGGPSTTSAPSPELDAIVRELSAYVEQQRGLKFKQAVAVTLLDKAAFRVRLLEEEEDDEEDIVKATKILRALGFIDDDVDLKEAVDQLLGEAVLGFYDPESNDLVVRGGSVTPGVRVTLVHELVHALQDQHFELHRPQLDERDDETSLGFTGLVEGDAVRVQDAYLATLTTKERAQANRENTADLDLDEVPKILLQTLVFPYVVGPEFARALVKEGGLSRLDQAFREPPVTSEHLLHPDRFLAGDGPRPVGAPTPPDGRPAIDAGVIGEFGIRLIVGETVGALRAVSASTGWGGDRYVAWDEDEHTCVRVVFVMDTERDTEQLVEALEEWVDDGDDRSIIGTGPVTLTSCG